jgi:Transcription elongation factor, N-terminal
VNVPPNGEERVLITRKGYNVRCRELERLENEERRRLSELLRAARNDGDLDDNPMLIGAARRASAARATDCEARSGAGRRQGRASSARRHRRDRQRRSRPRRRHPRDFRVRAGRASRSRPGERSGLDVRADRARAPRTETRRADRCRDTPRHGRARGCCGRWPAPCEGSGVTGWGEGPEMGSRPHWRAGHVLVPWAHGGTRSATAGRRSAGWCAPALET